jgi:hypothetical protein
MIILILMPLTYHKYASWNRFCLGDYDMGYVLGFYEYGFDSDIYYGTGGNNKAIQLVMDGLKLIKECWFVEGRDAIIKADAALYDGDNECLIRTVFARRGVGIGASQGTPSREIKLKIF